MIDKRLITLIYPITYNITKRANVFNGRIQQEPQMCSTQTWLAISFRANQSHPVVDKTSCNCCACWMHSIIEAVFRNSLPALKMYSSCYVYYTFSVLAVNFGTQPEKAWFYPRCSLVEMVLCYSYHKSLMPVMPCCVRWLLVSTN